MCSPHLPLLPAALLGLLLAIPAAAQPETADAPILARFAVDSTTVTALPWQQEPLGLSPEQTATLRGIAMEYQPLIEELYGEMRALFENVGMMRRPVEAGEAFALFHDVAAHKAEALATFHAAAEAMRAVLTPAQRAAWEALLETARREQ